MGVAGEGLHEHVHQPQVARLPDPYEEDEPEGQPVRGRGGEGGQRDAEQHRARQHQHTPPPARQRGDRQRSRHRADTGDADQQPELPRTRVQHLLGEAGQQHEVAEAQQREDRVADQQQRERPVPGHEAEAIGQIAAQRDERARSRHAVRHAHREHGDDGDRVDAEDQHVDVGRAADRPRIAERAQHPAGDAGHQQPRRVLARAVEAHRVHQPLGPHDVRCQRLPRGHREVVRAAVNRRGDQHVLDAQQVGEHQQREYERVDAAQRLPQLHHVLALPHEVRDHPADQRQQQPRQPVEQRHQPERGERVRQLEDEPAPHELLHVVRGEPGEDRGQEPAEVAVLEGAECPQPAFPPRVDSRPPFSAARRYAPPRSRASSASRTRTRRSSIRSRESRSVNR